MFDVLEAQRIRRPAMQKISTMRMSGKTIIKGQLTIGLDLGDRSSCYCVLDEAGEIILEQKLPTTPEAMKQTFGRMPRSRIAMETGTHSPDARTLARLARIDPQLLSPVQHRSAQAHAYTRADPAEKLEAIEAIVPPHLRKGSFRPSDKLIALLKTKT
jgi:hypothetical protein